MVRAERLGMTLDRFLAEVSSAELTLWVAHDRTHNSEGWQQAATIAATVASIFADQPVSPQRFLPYRELAATPPQSEEQVRAVMASMRG